MACREYGWASLHVHALPHLGFALRTRDRFSSGLGALDPGPSPWRIACFPWIGLRSEPHDRLCAALALPLGADRPQRNAHQLDEARNLLGFAGASGADGDGVFARR